MQAVRSALSTVATLLKLDEKLAEWSITLLNSEYQLINGAESELEKLRRTRQRIAVLLEDAEQRRYITDETVKLWLRELKNVFFDADDLLDRHQTQIQVAKLGDGGGASSKKRKRSWIQKWNPNETIFNPRKLAKDVGMINERLKEISSGRKDLRLRPGDGRERGESSVGVGEAKSVAVFVSVAADDTEIVGREMERRRIARMLREGHNVGITVIPIYGAPGVGKTTLAKLAIHDVDDPNWYYSPDDIVGKLENENGNANKDDSNNYFSIKVWVDLPKQCDLSIAMRQIIESITREKCDLPSLELLHGELKKLLTGCRFLLVLDNAWVEDDFFWEAMWLTLRQGESRSKVLITSRSEAVWNNAATSGNKMIRVLPIYLDVLHDDDCEALLLNRAFGRGSAAARDSPFQGIAKQIARKCQGSPLAAKSLGAILYHESNEEGWKNILDEIVALQNPKNGILPSLMISYHHLPYHLKQCFAYCSVFRNDYEFDKNEVVRLWIAEGLVQRIGRRRLEAIGDNYFEELVWRSFFRKRDNKYTIPSLICELAYFVSKYETLIVEGGLPTVEPEHKSEHIEARYASLLLTEDEIAAFKMLHGLSKLRTLKLCGRFGLCFKIIPADVPLKLRCLRVLDLSYSEVKELPDTVGKLIHLRYLGLAYTKVEKLPESVGDLYNLQVLDLKECYQLKELPRRTSDLVNLRHLDLHLNWDNLKDIESMPCGIGNLTSLQTLSRFSITPVSGCKIAELKKLNLRGELCITMLKNVVNPADAAEANLQEKHSINSLMLRWTNSLDNVHLGSSSVEDTAEMLCPSPNLKLLQIERYPGRRFPNWLGNKSLSNLEILTLTCCRKCEIFPSLGQLPLLRNLKVERMHGVESIGRAIGFPSLEILTLDNMYGLESLFEVGADDPIPKLRDLSVLHCPKLKALMNLPQELECLAVKNCVNLRSLSPLPFLHYLYVDPGNNAIIHLIERSRLSPDSTSSKFTISFFPSRSRP